MHYLIFKLPDAVGRLDYNMSRSIPITCCQGSSRLMWLSSAKQLPQVLCRTWTVWHATKQKHGTLALLSSISFSPSARRANGPRTSLWTLTDASIVTLCTSHAWHGLIRASWVTECGLVIIVHAWMWYVSCSGGAMLVVIGKRMGGASLGAS